MNRPTLDRCIACAERELRLRCGVYPKWVQQGRMSQAKADDEIDAQREIIRLLKGIEPKLPLETGKAAGT